MLRGPLLFVLTCLDGCPEGSFSHAPGSPFVIEAASNLALGDVNQDTYPDLVIAAGEGHGVSFLLGDGTGRFAPTSEGAIRLDVAPGEMLLTDLNEDLALDLAIASHDSYGVILLLGDGRGGFAPASGSPFPAASGGTPHNHGLLAGDVNEDGHVDLITVQSEDCSVAVLLGDGRGAFSSPPTPPFPVGPSPYPAALGDLDGDGHLDIAVPEIGTGRYYREHQELARTITLLLGDGQGGFAPAPDSPLAVTPGPFFVALGDLDDDGDLDLVATHDDSDRVTVLLNDGKARFRPAPHSPLASAGRPGPAVLADMNTDGKNDIVLTTGEGVAVLLGDGHGEFSPAPGSPYRAGPGTWRLAVGDLNLDGKLDVASTNFEANSVSVLLAR